MKCLHDNYIITAEDTAGFLKCGCPILSMPLYAKIVGLQDALQETLANAKKKLNGRITHEVHRKRYW